MKKHRPHKGSKSASGKAAKRAQNARQQAGAGARIAASSSQASTSPRTSNLALDWAWHQASGGCGPAKRAKGPPPKAGKAKASQASRGKQATKQVAAPSTKLTPALLARLQTPIETPPAVVIASAEAAGRWRPHRNAIAMLVPAALLAVTLAVTSRSKMRSDTPVATAELHVTPHSRFEMPSRRAASAARANTTPTAVAMAAAVSPPFVRPAERLASSVPMAVHDVDDAVVALKRSIAALQPPFTRPAERATATVPPTAYDLTSVVAALARDADAARPVFKRPAEGTIAALPPEAGAPLIRIPEGSLPTVAAMQPEVPIQAQTSDLQCRAAPVPAATTAAADLADDPAKFGMALAAAAKAQSNNLVIYNANYMTIAYPRGDVPLQFGVCTDVVIRAYRALNIDLQELVHVSQPGRSDPNIDHRRTELLRKFFATHGEQLAVSPYIEDYLPGDIVTYYRPQNKSSTAHIAVVTDVIAPSGRPMIAHNRGWGVQMEDALFVDEMTGHYRFRGPSAPVAMANAARGKPATKVAKASVTAVSFAAPVVAATPSSDVTAPTELPADSAPKLSLAGIKAALGGAGRRMGLGAGNATTTTARCEAAVNGARTCRPGAIR